MSQDLLQSVLYTVPSDRWPAPGAVLAIGASGGPDSTALAHLLQELNLQQRREWQLHLAHFNHGLRGPQSDADAEFVETLARGQGWAFTIEKHPAANPPGTRHAGHLPEETLRHRRYAFYERVLTRTRASVLAIAHHADDNAETILHRIIRGTGLRGLAGIPATRPIGSSGTQHLIRPLLRIRRAQILLYLSERKLAFCHDHTNESHEFTRNRIRNALLPELERTYNPAVCEALLRLAQQSEWVNSFLDEQVQLRTGQTLISIESGDRNPRTVILDAAELLRQPHIMQTELVRRAISQTGAGHKKITFEHVLTILELARNNVSGKRLQLPGLIVSYDRKRLSLTTL